VREAVTAYTRTRTEEEIRQQVMEILLERDIGDELTSQEETILAYAHYAAGEQAVRMWVGPDIETGGLRPLFGEATSGVVI
jgi:hypothetical protein